MRSIQQQKNLYNQVKSWGPTQSLIQRLSPQASPPTQPSSISNQWIHTLKESLPLQISHAVVCIQSAIYVFYMQANKHKLQNVDQTNCEFFYTLDIENKISLQVLHADYVYKTCCALQPPIVGRPVRYLLLLIQLVLAGDFCSAGSRL